MAKSTHAHNTEHTDDNDNDVIIIECGNELPQTGENGKWYHFQGDYYLWDGPNGEFINKGGDRPTRPPVNP